jgi:hypothetical protein
MKSALVGAVILSAAALSLASTARARDRWCHRYRVDRVSGVVQDLGVTRPCFAPYRPHDPAGREYRPYAEDRAPGATIVVGGERAEVRLTREGDAFVIELVRRGRALRVARELEFFDSAYVWLSDRCGWLEVIVYYVVLD